MEIPGDPPPGVGEAGKVDSEEALCIKVRPSDRSRAEKRLTLGEADKD